MKTRNGRREWGITGPSLKWETGYMICLLYTSITCLVDILIEEQMFVAWVAHVSIDEYNKTIIYLVCKKLYLYKCLCYE